MVLPDDNGRIARLLTSFVLIKEGLFPLTIDRDERIKYIDALESADKNEYQPLIDVISTNQIVSIERALNWKIIENTSGYNNVLNVLGTKLTNYRHTETEQQKSIVIIVHRKMRMHTIMQDKLLIMQINMNIM
ncbi:MAG: hypothetical protein K2L82_11360 [Lachnospiraceae bacterium]|nr:hypothetical protein [Lachnospiraceae bacterium]